MDSTIIDRLNNQSKSSKSVLRQKYIEVPLSVLDTRLKSWTDRRSIWNDLGMQSELGRSKEFSGYSEYDKWIDQKKITSFNGQNKKLKVSIFDPVLTELMYDWFCPTDGKVLDPFAGGSVRGIVASIKNFKYQGIELNEFQVRANEYQADLICDPLNQPV